jgi:pimeloyl-ACP methyl ester carboxylesterase
VLGEIDAPTLITFGARDLDCSPRFAEPLTSGIGGSELVVFRHLSHAGVHEDPSTTLDFLLRQRSKRARRVPGVNHGEQHDCSLPTKAGLPVGESQTPAPDEPR